MGFKTYLVENIETGYLKIGKSRKPKTRLHQLQTGCGSQLRLLYVIPWDCEFNLHQRFKHLRIRVNGEWFFGSVVIVNLFEILSEKNVPVNIEEF